MNSVSPDLMSVRGVRVERIADAADPALRLAAASIGRQQPTPLLPVRTAPDPVAAARTALGRVLSSDPATSGWVALDEDGQARALLAASLEVTDEQHPGYAYLPERYALAPLSSWHVGQRADLVLLPLLLERLRADAAVLGIRRLMVQLRPHDWVAGSVWRQLGLVPDAVMAFRTAALPLDAGDSGVRVRPAESADEEALVALAMEEHEYHARETRTGSRSNQAEGPTREAVKAWLSSTGRTSATVAVDPDTGAVLGCLALEVAELPQESPGRFYFPARYGYIGVTSVTAAARGRGVGRALAADAVSEFARLGVEHVGLHYIDDNVLSRPFWSRMGFAPHVVTLAGEVLG